MEFGIYRMFVGVMIYIFDLQKTRNHRFEPLIYILSRSISPSLDPTNVHGYAR